MDLAPPSQVSHFFQLEVNYAYLDSQGQRRDEYCLIDTISFEDLSTFEKALAKDVEAVKVLLGY